jgi:hypothetical protein
VGAGPSCWCKALQLQLQLTAGHRYDHELPKTWWQLPLLHGAPQKSPSSQFDMPATPLLLCPQTSFSSMLQPCPYPPAPILQPCPYPPAPLFRCPDPCISASCCACCCCAPTPCPYPCPCCCCCCCVPAASVAVCEGHIPGFPALAEAPMP